MAPQLAYTRGKLLKAGDAALLLPQAAHCKGPLDRLLIAHEGSSACFVLSNFQKKRLNLGS